MLETIKSFFTFLSENPFVKSLFTIALYALLTYISVKITKMLFNKVQARYAKASTQLLFIRHAVVGLLICIGIFSMTYQITALRPLVLSLLTSSSVIAVAVAFAAQEAVANIVSGIFLTIFRPFTIGDRINLQGQGITGFVEDINMRQTTIKTLENSRIIVPNSIINSELIENYNLNDEAICTFLEIGISYESDLSLATKIIEEEVVSHPSFIDSRTPEQKKKNAPKAKANVVALADSSVNLKIGVWTESPGVAYDTCSDLRKSIKARFAQEGIEIPYPHMVVELSKEDQ